MSYGFSQFSLSHMPGLHPVVIRFLYELIKTDDFRLLCGPRTTTEQWRAYREQNSTLKPPKGKHLIQPDGYAYAVDIEPWVNGKAVDTSAKGFGVSQAGQFGYFLRQAYIVAKRVCSEYDKETGEEFKARFGINWDMDQEILTDQDLDDWFHIEFIREAF